ncbi:peptide-methionine (R)-S-oxide reductase [Weissella confusa]|uniref:Peptide-methionine (R)-S-oxide reductase n=1 Tax=Weissella confusa TaxID=1583 RepID=A0A923NG02_WEICO|nr:peptide-methionine (R)-S-oxide reductase [Weissella confusa]
MTKYDKEALRQRLTPEEYAVTQEAATEAPFTGKYDDTVRVENMFTMRISASIAVAASAFLSVIKSTNSWYVSRLSKSVGVRISSP